jgi:hypothetical protein
MALQHPYKLECLRVPVLALQLLPMAMLLYFPLIQ